MKIVINAVGARAGGGLRHISPFVTGLAEAMPAARFVVYAGDAPKLLEIDQVEIERRKVRGGPSVGRLVWDQVQLPRHARSADVLLSPMNFGPVASPVPQVLFQRNPTYFDPRLLGDATLALRLKKTAYRLAASASIRGAAAVVVPSEAMANLVRRHVPARVRLTVIHHGFDADACRRLAASGDLPPSAAGWFRHEVRLLYVGSAAPHKNIEILAPLLAAVRGQGRDAALALTVAHTDPRAKRLVAELERLGMKAHSTFLGTLSLDAVFPVYAAASVVLLPSITESFGFTLLEAIATRTPVVASDIASNREIAGPLGRYYAPRDFMAASTLVQEALGDPMDDRQAADWLRRFSWESHCRAVSEVLSAVTP